MIVEPMTGGRPKLWLCQRFNLPVVTAGLGYRRQSIPERKYPLDLYSKPHNISRDHHAICRIDLISDTTQANMRWPVFILRQHSHNHAQWIVTPFQLCG
jgi:hypothetical protein